MTDLRKDPILNNHWVIMAANRAERPGAFIESPPFDSALPCPFCEGHEAETPHEVLAFREAADGSDQPRWRVRVVPNKFPAIESCGDSQPSDTGFYQHMDACGAHEVVIESPRHVANITDLSVSELTDVFLACQMRLEFWKRDRRMAYGQIFKNVGQAAGASLEHAHSQILVVPQVPHVVAAEMNAAEAHCRRYGRCLFCDVIHEELTGQERMIDETPHHLAFAPYAARLPFETWVLPKRHAGRYEQTPQGQLEDLAGMLRSVFQRLQNAAGRCAYNYVLHTLPFADYDEAFYHWHIEIVPALVRPAGFELGTGWFINPIAPEASARMMREQGR
jgi:UDPglucose--hexose-1-phosphate uridylyltransferase